MNSSVCTLFEGNYHYGVATLVNSLSRAGFNGDIYIGYRGRLPFWAKDLQMPQNYQWEGAQIMKVNSDVCLHFLPIDIDYHFTNYKPTFILDIWANIDRAKRIFYFDPDIVVKCSWNFFEKWLNYGIPLVHEITNHDMPLTHPVRRLWQDILEGEGHKVNNRITSYINAGFFGVDREKTDFIKLYEKFTLISKVKHGKDIANFTFTGDRSDPFYAKDQDAMNIAAMATECALSEYGPEGMDLLHGGMVMSHAIGSPKPWKKTFLKALLQGKGPTQADKNYWNNVTGPISPYTVTHRKMKRSMIKLTSFLSRFYSEK